MLLLFSAAMVLSATYAGSYKPIAWYRFENLTDATIDSSDHSKSLLLTEGEGYAKPAATTKGPVGSYLNFNAHGKSVVSSPQNNVSWRAVSPLDIR
jgi:hypothetical protein